MSSFLVDFLSLRSNQRQSQYSKEGITVNILGIINAEALRCLSPVLTEQISIFMVTDIVHQRIKYALQHVSVIL